MSEETQNDLVVDGSLFDLSNLHYRLAQLREKIRAKRVEATQFRADQDFIPAENLDIEVRALEEAIEAFVGPGAVEKTHVQTFLVEVTVTALDKNLLTAANSAKDLFDQGMERLSKKDGVRLVRAFQVSPGDAESLPKDIIFVAPLAERTE